MIPIDETPEVLKQFGEMYKDFRPLYQSARLSCIAFFRDGTWLNLASRLELREFPPTFSVMAKKPTRERFAYGSVLEALSYGLYPDKRHVIRESVQNAYDGLYELRKHHPKETVRRSSFLNSF